MSYQGYENWKSWSVERFASGRSEEADYFQGEFSGINLRGCRVLEIGFGNGAFLGWARGQGAIVFGTEKIAELCARAESAGFNVLDPDLSVAPMELKQTFELVVALDVLEHLTIVEIDLLLDSLATLMKSGAIFVARFPNGQSPLGAVYQNGDHTHRTVLSGSIMEQLVSARPFTVLSARNIYRVPGRGITRLLRYVRHRMQDVIEFGLNRIYGFNVPIGPNLVVRLQRK